MASGAVAAKAAEERGKQADAKVVDFESIAPKNAAARNTARSGAACDLDAQERRREGVERAGRLREELGEGPVTGIEGRLAYRFAKRAFDVAFSGCVLVVIAVPSLVLAAAIRLESKGNPFYSQVRVGRMAPDGSLTTFRMWKFRSMYADADERLEELREQNEISGAMFKMREDPRVTRIGRFSRRHSIDEFPQFVNVLLGKMSVVGPRPPLPREVELYMERDLRRLAVKLGITGWWQVTERNETDFEGMVKRDLEYIANRGILMDLKIIALTVVEMFTGVLSRSIPLSLAGGGVIARV